MQANEKTEFLLQPNQYVLFMPLLLPEFKPNTIVSKFLSLPMHTKANNIFETIIYCEKSTVRYIVSQNNNNIKDNLNMIQSKGYHKL